MGFRYGKSLFIIPQKIVLFSMLALFVSSSSLYQDKKEASQEEFSVQNIKLLMDRGISLLINLQVKDGYWASSRDVYPEQAFFSRLAVTAVVCKALLKIASDNNRAKEAVERGVRFILDSYGDKKGTRKNFDEGSNPILSGSDWGRPYVLELLADLYISNKERQDHEELKTAIEKIIQYMEKAAVKKGTGWHYLLKKNICSFTTAVTLLSFCSAKDTGFKVNQELIEKALNSLKKLRLETGAFCYDDNIGMGKELGSRPCNKVQGSVGRTSLCEFTLLRYDKGKEKDLEKAIQTFFEYWDEMKKVYKKIGHKGEYSIASYYFFFGHYYAAQGVAVLSDLTARDKYYRKIYELLLKTMEKDGGWNDDSRENGKPYCTAKILLILSLIRNHLDKKN